MGNNALPTKPVAPASKAVFFIWQRVEEAAKGAGHCERSEAFLALRKKSACHCERSEAIAPERCGD
jgi:hypothetical protein